MALEEREAIKYGHYDPEVQGEASCMIAIESDAKRRGMEPKAYKDLLTYVECIVMNKHGHMDEGEEDDEDGEF